MRHLKKNNQSLGCEGTNTRGVFRKEESEDTGRFFYKSVAL